MDPRFVDALVMQAIDATFLHSMDRCKWDPKTLTITTPDDVKREEEMALENAAWYKDEYGEHMSKKDKKDKKKEYAAPEVLYGIDDEHTYNTIHGEKGVSYAGTPGAAKLDLREKPRSDVEIDSNDDDMSALSDLSRGDLLELLRKHNISASGKGSGPKNARGKSASPSTSSGESSSESSSSTSHSSAETVGTAAPAGVG